jgi:SAM-dependent methyltransferase
MKAREEDLDYIDYWQKRYASGRTSGVGSYGVHAEYKASVVNEIVEREGIQSVLEFGCGDGNQLTYYRLPRYVGLDVAQEAVDMCSAKFAEDSTKSFRRYVPGEYLGLGSFDMTMAIEVLFHVTRDDDYFQTLQAMLDNSSRWVLFHDPLWPSRKYEKGSHEKHRELLKFLEDLEDFEIVETRIHPSITMEGRKNGEVGEMASDFALLRRLGA